MPCPCARTVEQIAELLGTFAMTFEPAMGQLDEGGAGRLQA